jgi:hypothetical protein
MDIISQNSTRIYFIFVFVKLTSIMLLSHSCGLIREEGEDCEFVFSVIDLRMKGFGFSTFWLQKTLGKIMIK